MSDLERLRNLQRDNADLSARLQSTSAELLQLQSTFDKLKQETDQKDRVSQRRLLEETANAKNLAVENDMLKAQVRNLESSVSKLNENFDVTIQERNRFENELEKTKEAFHTCRHELMFASTLIY